MKYRCYCGPYFYCPVCRFSRRLATVFACVALGVSLHATVPTFWLKVSPQVVAEGQRVQLMCHVPPHQDNRYVELGIEGYRSSRLPMEGENSPQTFQVSFIHMPCDVGMAYCIAGGIDESKAFWQTKVPLLVSGCNQ